MDKKDNLMFIEMKTKIIITGLIISVFLIIYCLTNCKKTNCIEQPKDDCFCTHHYDPVCGCNGKTYGNACEAQCNGIIEYNKGECK